MTSTSTTTTKRQTKVSLLEQTARELEPVIKKFVRGGGRLIEEDEANKLASFLNMYYPLKDEGNTWIVIKYYKKYTIDTSLLQKNLSFNDHLTRQTVEMLLCFVEQSGFRDKANVAYLIKTVKQVGGRA